MIRPMDANKNPLTEKGIKQSYGAAIQNNPDFQFSIEKGMDEIIKFVQKLILVES